jgi:hypothetical protein
VTVNSRDEAGVPPRTYSLPVRDALTGTLRTAISLDPAKHYDIYVSTVTGDPPVPSASRLFEIGPLGAAGRTQASLTAGLGRVVAWIRGHLPARLQR